ncbi:30S ribosomal protein S8 [Oenococcus alcoholitolerans]|uniref:30S ribosomal protein S8 n=1 Tax=Oenococcus alcoholitolerans TaxID=931074 RepID=UPI003F7024CE
MTMTDPIADFLTRIRNANLVRHETVEAPASKIKLNIAKILKSEGFITDYQVLDTANKQGLISLTLKYGPNRERVITGLKRISKPGLRSYVPADSIPKVLNGLGVAILSTSEGVLTDKEARNRKIGGEVLAYVW